MEITKEELARARGIAERFAREEEEAKEQKKKHRKEAREFGKRLFKL